MKTNKIVIGLIAMFPSSVLFATTDFWSANMFRPVMKRRFCTNKKGTLPTRICLMRRWNSKRWRPLTRKVSDSAMTSNSSKWHQNDHLHRPTTDPDRLRAANHKAISGGYGALPALPFFNFPWSGLTSKRASHPY